MSRKRYTPEQIIGMSCEAEIALAEGDKVGPICRRLGVSEQSYYRWRQHYNTIRPHSSLGYKPPAPEAILPCPAVQAYAMLQPEHQGINPRHILSFVPDHFVGSGHRAKAKMTLERTEP